ncbi:MAG: ABC transporter ATP-binding protein [Ardenticatenia bacterium]|nr:ABC transporter ATP-binding protein [Ardenticatenia bacterium]
MIDQPIVIRTHGLTKRFKKLTAVDDLNMQVRRGEVFGFLGPNGAGKTTAIALLLGLLRPTAGTAEVMGHDIRRQPAHALRRVGALVDAAFYPYLSAQDNLWVMAQMSGGGVSRRRIDEMLELVGLANRAGDKFRTFSPGMKQRLGLAAALVHDPEVLILDEPTHGLAPAGMLQIRDLIRHLSREQGKTVFLSSHLLHEVEQVCDRVLILDRGKTIAAGRVEEILQQGSRIEIRVNRPERAQEALRELDWVDGVSLCDEVLYVAAPPERAADLTAALAAQEIYPHGIRISERSLESFFLDVTAGGPDA